MQSQLDHLNRDLKRLLTELAELGEEQINWQPAAGKWSIGQILSHVMLSEKLSMAYVKKKLSFNPSLPAAGLGTHIRTWLLCQSLKSPFKFKAAKGVQTENLPRHTELVELEQEWLILRDNMASYLHSLDRKWEGKSIYKHPLAGRLSIPQMLQFFQCHFDRHARQIRNIMDQAQMVNQ